MVRFSLWLRVSIVLACAGCGSVERDSTPLPDGGGHGASTIDAARAPDARGTSVDAHRSVDVDAHSAPPDATDGGEHRVGLDGAIEAGSGCWECDRVCPDDGFFLTYLKADGEPTYYECIGPDPGPPQCVQAATGWSCPLCGVLPTRLCLFNGPDASLSYVGCEAP
jgi:hypothetical protein